jgi:hypothetical protein
VQPRSKGSTYFAPLVLLVRRVVLAAIRQYLESSLVDLIKFTGEKKRLRKHVESCANLD